MGTRYLVPKWVIEIARQTLKQQVEDAESNGLETYKDKTVRDFYASHFRDLGAIKEMLCNPIQVKEEDAVE